MSKKNLILENIKKNNHFQLPVLFLPELVGLACGMSAKDMKLDWHTVLVNVRL